jgi:hypothetical protein
MKFEGEDNIYQGGIFFHFDRGQEMMLGTNQRRGVFGV